MSGKSFFMDLSRCTACRGCQVACKQWKKLPATETKNWGSHQNPADLDFNTYKLVRFNEVEIDNKFNWLFFPDQCRHCIDPPCKAVADGYDERAVLHDPATGAVVFTQFTNMIEGIDDPMDLCPYNIPRRNAETGVWSKCDMCNDRVQNGMLPACVLSCPTGTMNYGDSDEMMDMAQKRLAVVKKTRPKAVLADADTVRVVVLLEFPPAEYYEYMVADAALPGAIGRRQMFAGLAKRLRVIG